jgi:hypothetical protein
VWVRVFGWGLGGVIETLDSAHLEGVSFLIFLAFLQRSFVFRWCVVFFGVFLLLIDSEVLHLYYYAERTPL